MLNNAARVSPRGALFLAKPERYGLKLLYAEGFRYASMFEGVGTITKEETLLWSLVGPVARARGVDIDVRRDHPYAAYDELSFEVPVLDGCDVWSTLVVRLVETFESFKLIRQCLDKMPAGPLMAEFADGIPPFRPAISCVEMTITVASAMTATKPSINIAP